MNQSQSQIDNPSTKFCQLLQDFENASNNYEKIVKSETYIIGKDCCKIRLIAKDIVIDIYWYPIDNSSDNNNQYRDWYDVTISSIVHEAKFIGSSGEMGDIFKRIVPFIVPRNYVVIKN